MRLSDFWSYFFSYALVNTVLQNAGVGGQDRDAVSQGLNLPEGSQVVTDPVSGNALVIGADGRVQDLGDLGLSQDDLNEGVTDFLTQDTNENVIANLLSNPLIVEGEGVQDFGGSAYYTPGSPLTFKIGTQGRAVFEFGDGNFGVLDTIQDPNATLEYYYKGAETYGVKVVFQSVTGEVKGFQKTLLSLGQAVEAEPLTEEEFIPASPRIEEVYTIPPVKEETEEAPLREDLEVLDFTIEPAR